MAVRAVGCSYFTRGMRVVTVTGMQAPPPNKTPSGPLADAKVPTSPLSQPPAVIPATPLGHLWALIGIAVGFYIAYTSWTGSAPSDDWGRRWTLVAIPFCATLGLLIGWWSAWRTVALAMVTVYLFSPFVAARVESCLLPIPDAVPCFADHKVVLDLASQLAHPVYYPVLLGLHLAGSFFVWSFVASKGGQNYVATASASPPTD